VANFTAFQNLIVIIDLNRSECYHVIAPWTMSAISNVAFTSKRQNCTISACELWRWFLNKHNFVFVIFYEVNYNAVEKSVEILKKCIFLF